MPETPDTAVENRARLRTGLLDQLAHLLREVEMLAGVIERVPGRLLAEAPPGERFSIKEIFALLALLDEKVHRPRLERIRHNDANADAPRFESLDPEALLAGEAWNERAIETIFARVRRARQDLIDVFEAVPPKDWLRAGHFPQETTPTEEAPEEQRFEERDLYEMAHAVCLRDTRRLRAMSRRLYESHLGPPPE